MEIRNKEGVILSHVARIDPCCPIHDLLVVNCYLWWYYLFDYMLAVGVELTIQISIYGYQQDQPCDFWSIYMVYFSYTVTGLLFEMSYSVYGTQYYHQGLSYILCCHPWLVMIQLGVTLAPFEHQSQLLEAIFTFVSWDVHFPGLYMLQTDYCFSMSSAVTQIASGLQFCWFSSRLGCRSYFQLGAFQWQALHKCSQSSHYCPATSSRRWAIPVTVVDKWIKMWHKNNEERCEWASPSQPLLSASHTSESAWECCRLHCNTYACNIMSFASIMLLLSVRAKSNQSDHKLCFLCFSYHLGLKQTNQITTSLVEM